VFRFPPPPCFLFRPFSNGRRAGSRGSFYFFLSPARSPFFGGVYDLTDRLSVLFFPERKTESPRNSRQQPFSQVPPFFRFVLSWSRNTALPTSRSPFSRGPEARTFAHSTGISSVSASLISLPFFHPPGVEAPTFFSFGDSPLSPVASRRFSTFSNFFFCA